jgi:SnoaL-like domain
MQKLFIVIVFFLAACNNAEQKADAAVSTTENTTAKTNVTTVENMFNAFNEHNWEKMSGYYTNPASFLDPEFGSRHVQKTHDEVVKHYSCLQQFSPDIKDSITFIAPVGDNKVVVQFTSSGTMSANKQPFSLVLCTMLTLENGKIVKDEVYYDKN